MLILILIHTTEILFPVLLLCDENGEYVDFDEKDIVTAIEDADDSDNLTWEGYEYLDKIRDDSIWKKVKDVAKDKGLPLAIDTVKQIASVIISSMTEGAIKAVTGV